MKNIIDKYGLLLVLTIGFGLRVFAINFDLPHLYQSEEYKVVNYTLKMAGTQDLNPHFFEYPSLYLYFMMGVYGLWFTLGKIAGVYSSAGEFAVSFIKDPSTIYLLGRFMSAVWGTLIIWITYKLANLLYNRKTAFLSAIMIAVLPIWVKYSHWIKPDPCSIFLGVLFVYLLMKYYSTDNAKYFLYSGIALGLAAATKYTSGFLGIMMLMVYFVHKRKISVDVKLILGICISLIVFLLGTPYSVLDYKNFIIEMKGITVPFAGMKRDFFAGACNLIAGYFFMGTKSFIIGLIGYLGLVYVLLKREKPGLLLVIPVLIYFIIVAFHYFPAYGFLFNAFPFFIILGARFIDFCVTRRKWLIYVFSVLLLIPLAESISINYTFTLKDTRTIAKEWIERNIPSGAGILIDMQIDSPPLLMSKKQLENLYKKAVQLNNYKKEYLKLKLDIHPGNGLGYKIYQIKRGLTEVGSPPNLVEKSQQVQPLLDITGGIKFARQNGVEYVILNSNNEGTVMISNNNLLKGFYESVKNKCSVLYEFKPETGFSPGPIIRIYKL